MSQNANILKRLQRDKRPLTAIEALHKFGCFRLAARINDLRNLGYDIKNIGAKKFAEYVLR